MKLHVLLSRVMSQGENNKSTGADLQLQNCRLSVFLYRCNREYFGGGVYKSYISIVCVAGFL